MPGVVTIANGVTRGPASVPASNPAPTDIALSASTIADNAAADTVVGTLSVTDPGESSWSFAITNGNTKFELSAASGATVNLERSASGTLTAGVDETVQITVTDGASNQYAENFTITVTSGAAGTLIEAVTLTNFSGASRTDPYVTFRRSFETGDVPSGSIVEVRYSGSAVSVQQADGRKVHSDGSLAHATFSFKPATGAVSDNATFTVDLYAKTGSWNNTAGPSLSTLTAQNYRIKCTISSTDYYCVLNNLINAGTYTTIRSGGCVLAIEAWGIFRQGTGASDTDQGHLQGKIWAYIWEDGRITIFARALNGRVVNGCPDYSVTDLVLQNGTTDIINLGSFTWYQHTWQALVAADGLPVWSATATDIWATVDARYLHDKKLAWNIHSSSTQRAAIGSGTALNYAANYSFTGGGTINQSGASAWIGTFPTWTVQAILTGDKTRIRNDRVNALGQGVLSSRAMVRHESGFPPVLTNADYTGSGLTAAQTSIGWSSGATITWTGTDHPESGGFSHGPEYCFFQWLTTGWEWWCDNMLINLISGVGGGNPGNQYYQRNAIVNSPTQHFGGGGYGQCRAFAWFDRTASNLRWTRPDAWPAAQYIDDLCDVRWAWATQMMTGPFSTSAMDTRRIFLTGDGVAEGISHAAWQHFYLALVVMLHMHRGHISSTHKLIEHVEKWSIDNINQCPYHAAGADRISIRDASPLGSTPNTGNPYNTDPNNLYYGGDGASLLTIKLISDSGGSSGSCPASGQYPSNEQYAARHTRPSIAHAACSIAAGLGLTGASSALTPLAAMETALNPAETDWNDAPQWRIRWPA